MFAELRDNRSPPRGRAAAVRAGFGERRDADGPVLHVGDTQASPRQGAELKTAEAAPCLAPWSVGSPQVGGMVPPVSGLLPRWLGDATPLRGGEETGTAGELPFRSLWSLTRAPAHSHCPLQLLPDRPGAHGVCREHPLPPASDAGHQPHVARPPQPEGVRQQTHQAPAAARHRGPPGPAVLGPLRPVPHQPPAGRPDTARGAVDSAGRVQVAQEALSPQLPRLRRGLLPPRHHRPGAAAAECGEAATHGAGAGGPEAGGAAAAAAPAGARGGAEPAAAQPSFLRKHVLAAVEAQTPDQHCDWSPWPGTKWCWQLSSWTLWDAWAAKPSSVDRRDQGAQLQVFLGGHSMPPCRTLG